ncbi:MAG: hypothetical protein U1F43_35820 [Myxococcota bacterium]
MRLTAEQVRACFEYRPDQPPERRFVPTPRFEQLARELSGSTARRDEKTWHLDYVGFGRALPAPGSNAMLVEVGFRWLSGNPEHPDERREVQTFLYHPEARDTAAALTETSAFLRWGDFVDRIRHRRLEAGEADLHHAPHGGKIRIAATVEGEVDEATDALVFMGVSLSLWSPVPWPFHGPSGVVMLPANEWYGPLPHDVLVPNGSSYDA